MSSINYVADLLDLVREAQSAQDTFDNWDEGFTYEDICGEPVKRTVALDIVVQELDEALLTLMGYIVENHEQLVEQIGREADGRERETSEAQ